VEEEMVDHLSHMAREVCQAGTIDWAYLPRGLNMVSPLLLFDKQLTDNSIKVIAGVDEVGLGAAAGPIVTCASIFTFSEAMWVMDIIDSKKISSQKRTILSEHIINRADSIGIGIASVHLIEKEGLGVAHKIALQRAIDALHLEPDLILVDGNLNKNFRWRSQTKQTKWIVKGDTKSLAIASASIVAKVFRDGLMAHLAEMNPGYDWEKNVGYRTKGHYASIGKLGLTSFHRRNSSDMQRYI